MIAKNGWQDKFQQAFQKALSYNTVEYENLKTLDDYFDMLESNLHWVPTENEGGTTVYEHVTTFYFLLDQSPVKELQTPIIPSKLKDNVMPPLSELSAPLRDRLRRLDGYSAVYRCRSRQELLRRTAVQDGRLHRARRRMGHLQPVLCTLGKAWLPPRGSHQ